LREFPAIYSELVAVDFLLAISRRLGESGRTNHLREFTVLEISPFLKSDRNGAARALLSPCDNSTASLDSRFLGFVPAQNIKGRIVLKQ
jgi:hypothetical protein